jgi:hypothetical protein
MVSGKASSMLKAFPGDVSHAVGADDPANSHDGASMAGSSDLVSSMRGGD